MKKLFIIFLLVPQLALSCQSLFMPDGKEIEKGNYHAPRILDKECFKDVFKYSSYVFTGDISEINCAKQKKDKFNKFIYTYNIIFKLDNVWKWVGIPVEKSIFSFTQYDPLDKECKSTYKKIDVGGGLILSKNQKYIIEAKLISAMADTKDKPEISFWDGEDSFNISQKIEDLRYDLKEFGTPIYTFKGE